MEALSPDDEKKLAETRVRRDVQSKRMSELLLQGWKMLGECLASAVASSPS